MTVPADAAVTAEPVRRGAFGLYASAVFLALGALVAAGAAGGEWRDVEGSSLLFWFIACAASNLLPAPVTPNVQLTMSSPINLAIAFLFQAITALRPGQFRPKLKNWSRERGDFPLGVRYFEDIVHRSTIEHWDAWQVVTLRQLNSELAVQVHSLALKNAARKKALRRLYSSLRIMTAVFAAILILFVAFTFL